MVLHFTQIGIIFYHTTLKNLRFLNFPDNIILSGKQYLWQISIKNDFLLNYQNLSPSTSLDDNLNDTFDSVHSDFEMLQNPIYYSNSSNNSFAELYSRVTDSPNIPLSSSPDSETLPTDTRARHSQNNLRSFPPKY